MRDSLFVLRPDAAEPVKLNHSSIKLTTKQTVAFFDFVVDFAQLRNLSANPATAMLLQDPALQNSKLLQLAPDAFGPDCALSLNWPESQRVPGGAFAVSIKDKSKAEQCLQEVLTFFPETSVTDLNGHKYYSFPTKKNEMFSPSLILADGYLLVGIDAAQIDRVRQSISNDETLQNSPAFASAREAYRSANQVFGYLDIRTIFERGYPTVSQILSFSVNFVPGLSDAIDASKLPDTETIAKHLQPIVYSQSHLPDGYLVESSGPITMNQAVLLGAGIGSFFGPKAD
jgi:hypothetical protein